MSDGLRRAREHIDPRDGTFITTAADPAPGTSVRLAGMAIAVKDMVHTAGQRTTCGARVSMTMCPG